MSKDCVAIDSQSCRPPEIPAISFQCLMLGILTDTNTPTSIPLIFVWHLFHLWILNGCKAGDYWGSSLSQGNFPLRLVLKESYFSTQATLLCRWDPAAICKIKVELVMILSFLPRLGMAVFQCFRMTFDPFFTQRNTIKKQNNAMQISKTLHQSSGS